MKDLALLAIDTARQHRASYADVRIIHTSTERLTVRNGALGELVLDEDLGFGVRVLADGAWGFACSPRVNRDEVQRVAAQAVAVARASAKVKAWDVRLADEPVWEDVWCTPYVINPFQVPREEKLELLFSLERTLHDHPEISVADASMGFLREKQWFAAIGRLFPGRQPSGLTPQEWATMRDEGPSKIIPF